MKSVTLNKWCGLVSTYLKSSVELELGLVHSNSGLRTAIRGAIWLQAVLLRNRQRSSDQCSLSLSLVKHCQHFHRKERHLVLEVHHKPRSTHA